MPALEPAHAIGWLAQAIGTEVEQGTHRARDALGSRRQGRRAGRRDPRTRDARVNLESHLRARRDEGRKLLVPYVTGGLERLDRCGRRGGRRRRRRGGDRHPVLRPGDGRPDDPGRVASRARRAAPRRRRSSTEARDLDVDVPLAVMTYCNLVFHAGCTRFARALAEAGIDGAILPDLPLGEIDEWAAAADDAGIETVMLAAPNSTDERLARDRGRARVASSTASRSMGVTGEREELAAQAVDHRPPGQGRHRRAGAARRRHLHAGAGGRGGGRGRRCGGRKRVDRPRARRRRTRRAPTHLIAAFRAALDESSWTA